MSLINDALKQARSAQPNAPATADGPILRPDFSARRSPGGNGLLLPALIVVIMLLAAALLLQWFRSGGPAPLVVNARSTPDAPSTPSPQPAVSVAMAPTSAPTASEKIPASNAPVASLAPITAPASATNAPVVVAAPAPPPKPTYKLQSLFYRPRNPSAVINGKTIYVGDRVGEAHVVAIDKDSVTIVTSKGETNVLDSPD